VVGKRRMKLVGLAFLIVVSCGGRVIESGEPESGEPGFGEPCLPDGGCDPGLRCETETITTDPAHPSANEPKCGTP
jgi:hypothetical protein